MSDDPILAGTGYARRRCVRLPRAWVKPRALALSERLTISTANLRVGGRDFFFWTPPPDPRPGGIPPVVGATRGGPFISHEPRRLQVLYKPLSSDPRHRIVSVIYPLSTLVAERERQSLGDLICGGRAKGRNAGHTRMVADHENMHVKNIRGTKRPGMVSRPLNVQPKPD